MLELAEEALDLVAFAAERFAEAGDNDLDTLFSVAACWCPRMEVLSIIW
ncbi:MAG: hypothetical protein LH610_06750 [Sphingomonas bacterium]|nr:hypothetical protein [Sphingomonas bacterium]